MHGVYTPSFVGLTPPHDAALPNGSTAGLWPAHEGADPEAQLLLRALEQSSTLDEYASFLDESLESRAQAPTPPLAAHATPLPAHDVSFGPQPLPLPVPSPKPAVPPRTMLQRHFSAWAHAARGTAALRQASVAWAARSARHCIAKWKAWMDSQQHVRRLGYVLAGHVAARRALLALGGLQRNAVVLAAQRRTRQRCTRRTLLAWHQLSTARKHARAVRLCRCFSSLQQWVAEQRRAVAARSAILRWSRAAGTAAAQRDAQAANLHTAQSLRWACRRWAGRVRCPSLAGADKRLAVAVAQWKVRRARAALHAWILVCAAAVHHRRQSQRRALDAWILACVEGSCARALGTTTAATAAARCMLATWHGVARRRARLRATAAAAWARSGRRLVLKRAFQVLVAAVRAARSARRRLCVSCIRTWRSAATRNRAIARGRHALKNFMCAILLQRWRCASAMGFALRTLQSRRRVHCLRSALRALRLACKQRTFLRTVHRQLQLRRAVRRWAVAAPRLSACRLALATSRAAVSQARLHIAVRGWRTATATRIAIKMRGGALLSLRTRKLRIVFLGAWKRAALQERNAVRPLLRALRTRQAAQFLGVWSSWAKTQRRLRVCVKRMAARRSQTGAVRVLRLWKRVAARCAEQRRNRATLQLLARRFRLRRAVGAWAVHVARTLRLRQAASSFRGRFRPAPFAPNPARRLSFASSTGDAREDCDAWESWSTSSRSIDAIASRTVPLFATGHLDDDRDTCLSPLSLPLPLRGMQVHRRRTVGMLPKVFHAWACHVRGTQLLARRHIALLARFTLRNCSAWLRRWRIAALRLRRARAVLWAWRLHCTGVPCPPRRALAVCGPAQALEFCVRSAAFAGGLAAFRATARSRRLRAAYRTLQTHAAAMRASRVRHQNAVAAVLRELHARTGWQRALRAAALRPLLLRCLQRWRGQLRQSTHAPHTPSPADSDASPTPSHFPALLEAWSTPRRRLALTAEQTRGSPQHTTVVTPPRPARAVRPAHLPAVRSPSWSASPAQRPTPHVASLTFSTSPPSPHQASPLLQRWLLSPTRPSQAAEVSEPQQPGRGASDLSALAKAWGIRGYLGSDSTGAGAGTEPE